MYRCFGIRSCSIDYRTSPSASKLTFSGVFIANADGSIVLATYGIIASDIGSLDNASWLVVTYTLAMCAIQPTVSGLCVFHSERCSEYVSDAVLIVWQIK